MKSFVFAWVLLPLTSLLTVGCEKSTSSVTVCRGTERCACYGNATCDEGLECHSDLCVKAELSVAPEKTATTAADAAAPGQGSDGAGMGSKPNGTVSGAKPQVKPASTSGAASTVTTDTDPGVSDASSPASTQERVAEPEQTTSNSSVAPNTSTVATAEPPLNPPGKCSDVPLVWITLGKGGGMFAPTVIGETQAWDVIVQALVGAQGLIPALAGKVEFGLTLYDGSVAEATCPRLVDILPASGGEAIKSALQGVVMPTTKQESPQGVAYADALAALRARSGSRKYVLAIGNSVPDFCDDGSYLCARDAAIGDAQAAYADGIVTLVAGVEHPAGDGKGALYFQSLANAGAGLPTEGFSPTGSLALCTQGANGVYTPGPNGKATFAYGSLQDASFATTLNSMLTHLPCVED